MKFPYNIITSAQDYLDVDNVANLALELIAEDNLYYFYTKTENGKTQIVTYGPVEVDGYVPEKSKYTYTKIDYSSTKINSAINKFLLTESIKTIKVNIVSFKYIQKRLVDYLDYIGDNTDERGKDN